MHSTHNKRHNYDFEGVAKTLTGTDQDDILVDGSLNDTLNGGDGNDHLASYLGADTLVGGDGNDIVESRSDAGEPAPAQGVAARGTLQGDEDSEGRAHGYFLPTQTDDVLTGGNGADTFFFRGDIDARISIAAKHTNGSGVIRWKGVAGENDNTHDHWVDSIGDDLITDFDASEGDKIMIEAHTVKATYTQIDADGDGQADDTLITLTSDQGGTAADPNGAHDQDALGTITVLNANADVVEANTHTHAHALHGTAYTLAELIADNNVAQGLAVDVTGGKANDRIIGGATADTINGGRGHDVLAGGAGNDEINGGNGADVISGGGDHDNLSGGNGTDTIDGGDGNDTIDGGNGSDTLNGGLGRDTITGGGGKDVINGGSDNDTLYGGRGTDTIDGGDGDDTIDGGTSADTLNGGRGRDTITGGGGKDVINGGSDHDVLSGGRGADTIDGGDGNDILNGGTGRDTLIDGAGNDVMDGGGNHDILSSFLGADTLLGGDGNDRLESRSDAGEPVPAQTGDANDRVNQGFNPAHADDVLTGGAGKDTFYFRLDINAKEEIAAKHTKADGAIHWHGVAGENDNVHDHWVEGIGNDVITDYNANRDKIVIEGHTVTADFSLVDADNDGDVDDTLITLYSDQGGSVANPNGAHDQDQLGTISVLNAELDAGDVTVDAGVHYGAFATLSDLQDGWV